MSGEGAHDGLGFPRLAGDDPWELVWCAGSVEIVGASVAALASAFAVPSYGAAVDMGRCSPTLAAQDTVLLTHCHSDHVAGLVAWLSAHTRRYREAPARIVLPAGRRRQLLEALRLWPDLDGVRRRVKLEEVLVGAEAGECFALGGGGQARAFDMRHTVPSLGWAVGPAGRRPEIVFGGDGTVEPFRDSPALLDAALAVVDCTLVEPGTRVAARLAGHGHLQDWLELGPSLGCDALALAHLPAGLRRERLVQLTRGAWPAGGPRLVAWMAPHGGERS